MEEEKKPFSTDSLGTMFAVVFGVIGFVGVMILSKNNDPSDRLWSLVNFPEVTFPVPGAKTIEQEVK